jgi:hypothetical protein
MIGKPPDDEDKLFCLLNGIKSNPEYGMISEILKSSDNMTFDKACHRLQDREVEAFTKSSVKNDSVNYVNKQNKFNLRFNENSQSKTIFCNYCKRKGHKYDDCDKRLKRCHRCHKTGHQIKNCRMNINNESADSNSSNNNTNNSKSNDKNSFVGYLGRKSNKNTDWIIDSGCTSHYCNNISLLSDIENEESTVVCANNEKLTIKQIGKIYMSTEDINITLLKVKYHPSFAQNLISISKLVENGATVKFEQDETFIEHKGAIVMKGIKRDGLYYLNCETQIQNNLSESSNFINEKLTESELIHNRLGHIGNTGLKQLFDKEAVNGIDLLTKDELTYCDTCCIGKAHRNAFGNHSSRDKAKLC